jgi:hypothetical protein
MVGTTAEHAGFDELRFDLAVWLANAERMSDPRLKRVDGQVLEPLCHSLIMCNRLCGGKRASAARSGRVSRGLRRDEPPH